jgi:hypothetical protein
MVTIETIEARKKIGNVFALWDTIENKRKVDRMFEELRGKPKIVLFNHFSYPDSLHATGANFRIPALREEDMEWAVTKYLLTWAQKLNDKYKLGLILRGVVTPSRLNNKEYQQDGPKGLKEHLRAVKSVVEANGVAEFAPSARRVKGGMGEPEYKVVESVLRLVGDYDPVIIPKAVFVWLPIKPAWLYSLWHFFGYRVRYGYPVTMDDIKENLRKAGKEGWERFEGADLLVYGMIKGLLPRRYR